MLFDRFSFRERESGLPEDDAVVADLPTESRSYSFNFDTRQLMFLLGGYCFLCILVFALGVVVGRATTEAEVVADKDVMKTAMPAEPPPANRPDLASSGRIPIMPPSESRSPVVQGPEFAFSPTLPDVPPASKPESASTIPARPRPALTSEVSRGSEPPVAAPRIEEPREVEPRRLATVVESKPKVTAAPRVALARPGDFTVQVSSFRSMDQASELKGRLSKKGYAAYVQSVDLSDKGTWHRVRIGSYRDKDGAERVASDLRSRESLPATVMKR